MSQENRYSRQLSLKEIGPQGQEKIGNTRIAIVGCGGLGAIASAYLAGAGVGQLLLVDGDRPSLSNLHRQVFFKTGETANKAVALAAHLMALNPEVETRIEENYLSKQTIGPLMEDFDPDLVLECTDQARIKHMISDYCAIHEIPLIYGAIHKSQGYLALFANQQPEDCHLRDLFPEPDDRLPTCAEAGVLGTAAGLIGLLQANEALKWILGIGASLRNRLLTYDCLRMQQQIIQLTSNFEGDLESIWERSVYTSERPAAQVISAQDLASWPEDSYQLISLFNEKQEPQLPSGAVRYAKGILESGPAKKVFYCKMGRQSRAVVSVLREQGVDAYVLDGDIP